MTGARSLGFLVRSLPVHFNLKTWVFVDGYDEVSKFFLYSFFPLQSVKFVIYRIESFLPVEGNQKALFVSFIQVSLYKFGQVGCFRDNSARHKPKLGVADYLVQRFRDPVSEDFGENFVVRVKGELCTL